MRAQFHRLRSLFRRAGISRQLSIPLAAAMMFVAAGAHAAGAEMPRAAATRILLVDTDLIWARYANPKSSEQDRDARKAELIKSMQPTLKQLSDSNGGAIVLDKEALFPGVAGGDITPWVIADLDKIYVPLDSSAPPPISHPAKAIALHVLAADRADVTRILKVEGYHDPDGSLLSATRMTEAAYSVDAVIDFGVVLMGIININITTDLEHFLRGGKTKNGNRPPAPLVHVVVMNRDDLFERSRAGKSVTAQVESLTQAADAEFAARRSAMDKEAADLQAKMASLDPGEQKQEIDAFNAKADAFNADIKERQHAIGTAVVAARHQIDLALDPIVKSLMRVHGANLLIESRAALRAPDDLDITADAIGELDAAMSSVPLQMPVAAASRALNP